MRRGRVEDMKRYLIFALLGPFIGGFILLLVTTSLSGYWTAGSGSEITKLFSVFFKTLQFTYLFGLIPTLILAALDEILVHVRRLPTFGRIAVIGICAFFSTAFLYGSKGSDSGPAQFILFGLVGLVPGLLTSWLASRIDHSVPVGASA